MVPETRTMKLADLKAAPYNPRRITDRALAGLTESVRRFGLVQPIIYNKATGHVVGGHQRVKALKATGATEALVVVVDLPDTEERALNVALNSPAIAGEFTEGLQAVLDEVQRSDEELFKALMLDEVQPSALEAPAPVEPEQESNYTRKIESPVYTPTMERPPPIADLMDTSKADELCRRVKLANLPPDVESFLLRAAERHVVFSYSSIAEFYAHASPEVQDQMEASALVIIDYDRAVEEGFVKLTQRLAALAGGDDA